MSDGDYDEGGLVIDEDRLDTSGDSNQQKVEEFTEAIDVSTTVDECTSEVIEQGIVSFSARKLETSTENMDEKPSTDFNNFPNSSFVPKFVNGPEEENSSDSQNFGFTGNKRAHPDNADLAAEPGNEGIKNFLAMKSDPAETKKKKVKMVDSSTCVLTKGSQVDETHLHLRPGMTTCINITIVYRAGANTYYVIAKFKGKEYHGILTDGEPPLNHTYFQKRSAASTEKEDHHANDEQSKEKAQSHTTSAHKHRNSGKRGGRNGAERKIRTDSISEENKNADSSHQLKTPKSSKIFEFTDKQLQRCPHQQCGFRFETINEMNAHLTWDHVDTKAVIKEEIACQASVETASIGVGTDSENDTPKKKEKTLCSKCQCVISDRQRQIEDESIKDLIKAGRSSNSLSTTNKTGSPAFSDISDDAPTLEKEAPFETSTDANNADSPKKSLSEPMLINTNASSFAEMLNPGRALATNTTEEPAKINEASLTVKQASPTTHTSSTAELRPSSRAAEAPTSIPSASSPSTPKRPDYLTMATTPQARRTPQHPPTPNSSNLPATGSTPTTMSQQIPPGLMAGLQGIMGTPFALPSGPFNAGFPMYPNRPMMPGLATNGLSPVPNPPKADSAPIRHKIHELKTEAQPSGVSGGATNSLSTPARPSTSNSTPANPAPTMPSTSDIMTQQAALRGAMHLNMRVPSMQGMSAFGFPGQQSLNIPQPTPMMAPSPQQVQAQQQQQQQAQQAQMLMHQLQLQRPMGFLPPHMGNMFPGNIPPDLASLFASAGMNTSGQQNPGFPPK